MVKLETPVFLVCLDDQASKVSRVSQEALDVQGLMALRERRESPVLEANQDRKVSLGKGGTPEFQVLQERVTMAQGEKMAFQDFLDLKASLEKSWGQDLDLQDRKADLEYPETRACQGLQEHLEHPVLMDALAFPE